MKQNHEAQNTKSQTQAPKGLNKIQRPSGVPTGTKNQTLQGILLSKTALADDDMLLHVFSPEHGLVPVFARKLARSQKKIREIDFFRIIEFNLFQGRSSYSLRGARTVRMFSQFSTSYKCLETGFNWKKRLTHIVPEGESAQQFFTEIEDIFHHYETSTSKLWDAIFRIRCLAFMGLLESTPHHTNKKDFLAIAFLRQPTSILATHSKNLNETQILNLHRITRLYEEARMQEIV